MRGNGGERGIALVLVVWILTVLAVVSGEFLYSSRLRVKADGAAGGQVAAYALALAGYYAALDRVGADLKALSRGDDGVLLLHGAEPGEGVPALARDVSLGGGTYSFVIDDEDGRIDINRQSREVLVALLKEAGMELGAERDGLADSILDWRDGNREHHLNGAEEDYYMGLEKPYSCKDGPFDTREELLLVKGMKREYFNGAEGGEGGEEGGSIVPLRDLVTVYPVTFNPGTAPPEVLQALGRPRSTAPSRVSQFYSIVALGREEPGGAARAVRAVVLREPQGGKIRFRLLYWDDNYPLRGSKDALG